MLYEAGSVPLSSMGDDRNAANRGYEPVRNHETEAPLSVVTTSDMGDVVRLNGMVDVPLRELSKLFAGTHQYWAIEQRGSTSLLHVRDRNGRSYMLVCNSDKTQSLRRIASHYDKRQLPIQQPEVASKPTVLKDIAQQWLEHFQLESKANAETYQFETRALPPLGDQVTIWYDTSRLTLAQKQECWQIIEQQLADLRLRKHPQPKQLVLVLHTPITDEWYGSYAQGTTNGAEAVVNMADRGGIPVLRHELVHAIMAMSSNLGVVNDVIEGMAGRLANHFGGGNDQVNQPSAMFGYSRLRGVSTGKLGIASHTQFIREIGKDNDQTSDYEYSYLVGYALVDAILNNSEFARYQQQAAAVGETPYLALHELVIMLNNPAVIEEALSFDQVTGTYRMVNSKQIAAALLRIGFDPNEVFSHMQQTFRKWRNEQSPPQNQTEIPVWVNPNSALAAFLRGVRKVFKA